MLDLLRSTADKNCPKCEILCLGTYLKTFQYHANSDKVSVIFDFFLMLLLEDEAIL